MVRICAIMLICGLGVMGSELPIYRYREAGRDPLEARITTKKVNGQDARSTGRGKARTDRGKKYDLVEFTPADIFTSRLKRVPRPVEDNKQQGENKGRNREMSGFLGSVDTVCHGGNSTRDKEKYQDFGGPLADASQLGHLDSTRLIGFISGFGPMIPYRL